MASLVTIKAAVISLSVYSVIIILGILNPFLTSLTYRPKKRMIVRCTMSITPMQISSIAHSKMYHIVVSKLDYVSNIISMELKSTNIVEAKSLIEIGAVYHRVSPSDIISQDDLIAHYKVSQVKPQRLLADIIVQKNDYLRVHTTPRRYPTHTIDWGNRIMLDKKDFMIIDKPAGIPSHPTVDNFYENVFEGLKLHFNLKELYLPHRLDTDTSGLLMFGKNKRSIGRIGNLFRNRYISKIYRTVVVSSTYMTSSSSPKCLQSLLQNQVLTHYTKPSLISPKVFSSIATDGSVACYSRVVGVSPVLTKSYAEWLTWLNSLPTPPLPNGTNEYEGPYEPGIHGFQSPDIRFAHAFNSWLDNCLSKNETVITFCEIELELLTGRTHQVRGQMHSMGEGVHIAGDLMYTGFRESNNADSAIATDWPGNLNECLDSDTESEAYSVDSTDMSVTSTDTIPAPAAIEESSSHYQPSRFLALQACCLDFNYPVLEEVDMPEGADNNQRNNGHNKISVKAARKAMRKQYLKSMQDRDEFSGSNVTTASATDRDTVDKHGSDESKTNDKAGNDFAAATDAAAAGAGKLVVDSYGTSRPPLQYEHISVRLGDSWWQPLTDLLKQGQLS